MIIYVIELPTCLLRCMCQQGHSCPELELPASTAGSPTGRTPHARTPMDFGISSPGAFVVDRPCQHLLEPAARDCLLLVQTGLRQTDANAGGGTGCGDDTQNMNTKLDVFTVTALNKLDCRRYFRRHRVYPAFSVSPWQPPLAQQCSRQLPAHPPCCRQ